MNMTWQRKPAGNYLRAKTPAWVMVTRQQTTDIADGVMIIGKPEPGGVAVAGGQDVLYFSVSNDCTV